ncbi:MAG: hypothetical protein FWG88_07745 [Oscillospiraceae bacterium]|nr:hypothetical protein [Oscillospiraceae bacterium]
MGITYYAFALFIAALVCLIGILYKLLFGNVKRQRKLLEEKESNILQLYQTIESIMDEFTEQIAAAMDDIKEYESRAAATFTASQARLQELRMEEAIIERIEEEPAFVPILETARAPAMPMTVDATRIRAASEVLERAERMVRSPVGRSADYIVGDGDNGEVVQRLLDDDPDNEPQSPPSTIQGNIQGKSNKDAILTLAEEGKTQAQIAQELGITQNEVKLVIDLVAHMASG